MSHVTFESVGHPRFSRAQRDIFIKKVAPDCLSHQCRLLNHGNRVKLEACCQYGVDVDVTERDRILEHEQQIAAILSAGARDQAWFSTDETVDPDFPSGLHVRTMRHGDGCVFLAHDQRGCAIHRASIEGGWDFCGVKPHVCRLFPLSYDTEAIVLSDDYADYSCSLDADAPSVYRVGRETLGAVFGAELIIALDAVEQRVLAEPASALRVLG